MLSLIFQVTCEAVSSINFEKPKHSRKRKHYPADPPTKKVPLVDEEEALRQLKLICPEACILTKTDSDTDTASDDEDLPPVSIK